MNIPGVPDSIQWQTVADFLVSIGIDVNHLTRDGIHIGWKTIECTVYATNAEGRHYADRGSAVQHRISIPITRPNDTEE